jgi:hypothetical protein
VAAEQIAAIATQNVQQMRQARTTHSSTHGAAYSSAPSPARNFLGLSTFECQGCSALHFEEEKAERGFFPLAVPRAKFLSSLLILHQMY